MLEIAATCPHCGQKNTITEIGTEDWEPVTCHSCKRPMGTLRELTGNVPPHTSAEPEEDKQNLQG